MSLRDAGLFLCISSFIQPNPVPVRLLPQTPRGLGAHSLHSSTSARRNRQHRSDERPHGPALKGYRFHVTGVTKRYLRSKSGLRFERTFPIHFSLVCLPRHAHREILPPCSSGAFDIVANESRWRRSNWDTSPQMLIDHRSVHPWGR